MPNSSHDEMSYEFHEAVEEFIFLLVIKDEKPLDG